MTPRPLEEVVEEEEQLLKDLDQALYDWMVTYCGLDHFTGEQFEASINRITGGGGTLAYIADLRSRIKHSLAEREKKIETDKNHYWHNGVMICLCEGQKHAWVNNPPSGTKAVRGNG